MSECRVPMMCPDMSMVGKTQGNQDELPGGGPGHGMEGGEEEAEFSHQRGALAQLQVGVCSGRTRLSWKAIQGFEVRPRKASIWSQVRRLHRYCGQVPRRQLVRVDSDVKRKPAGCSFRKSQGTGATFLGVKRGWR